MKSLIIIMIGLYGSWHFMDISSEHALYAALCPILFILFLISAALWLVTKAGFDRRTSKRDGGSFFDIGDGGGD
ncbi:MAG: hypothetical protein ACMZ64_04090 [Oleiphilus sp.]